MTRKKSNVKALALAVTCAILAGGYSGLNPVYAETPVYHDVVKYDSANRTLDYEFDAGAGTGTAAIQKINFGNIVLDGSSGAGVITATGLKLNGIGDVKTAIEGKADQAAVTDNKNNIQTLETKTKNISYNATTGTTVEGVVLKDKGISAAGGKFTVKADGQTVFTGAPDDKDKTTIKNGETVVEGANGKVTINNSGIDIAQTAQDTGESYSIKLDSGYVKASGYVQAPKFYIDNNNVFAKEADGTSRLTVSDVDEIGAVTKFVRIGGGTISASGDVNVAGNLWVGKTSIFNDGINTDKIDEKTTGAGVTVEGVKFKAGAVSGISDINDGIIKFSKNGTKDIVQINSDLMFNDDAGQQAATLTLEGVKTLNGLSNGSSKIKADDGSVVGGVKFDNKNITDVDSVMVNKDANNQVQINSEGIVVGLHSTVIGSDGVYAGGHTATTAKAVLGADGSIKGAGDGAGKYKFTVDGATGNVVSKGSVTANQAGFNDLAVTNGLTVGSAAGDFVNMQNGNVVATGSVTAKGGLSAANGNFTVDGTNGNTAVGGTLSVAGETTFANGIKTDKIDEATANTGVTVDGVLLKDKGIEAADGKFKVDGTNGNISTDGSVTAKGGLSAANNAFKVDGTNGDISTDGNLVVKQKITGQSLNIGATGTEFTVDTVGNVTANGITTNDTTTNKIGGVTLAGSDINAKNLTLTGTLTAAKYNATDIEATNSIKVGATIMTNGKLDLGSNGTIDFGANELTDVQVGNINSVIQPGGIVKAADGSVIGGVSFSAKDITGVKDLTATGTVTAATITDGTASLSGGALTGLASVNIGGNTTIDSTGIETNKLSVGSGLNATTIDDANGVVSAKGEIGAVKFSGSGKLDNVTAIDGVSVAQNSGSAAGGLTFGGNAIIGATGIPFQSTGFKVDDDGDVEGKTFTTAADGTGNRSTLASGQLTIDSNNTWTKDNGIIASNVKVGTNELKGDGLHVGTNTLVKDGEITVGAGNSWSMANGIAATKAAINGVTIGETAGKAVFNKAGKSTTIDGDAIETGKITADELLIDKISLGKGGSSNITIDKDGHVQTKGDIKITDAAGNVMSKLSQDKATFGNAAENQTTINNGKLKAKAKNTANQQAEFNFDENGLTVSGQNAAGDNSSFGFNAANGVGTFTDKDGTTTAIKGSAITSTNSAATGVLDGSNLTLTNGANSTALTAGGATFTGAAGDSSLHGTETKIDGGIITTDTLNVERINLGGELYDKNGTAIGGNLSMDKDGNFSAAGGNFKVTGGTGADKGAFTNTVGNTTLQTDTTGASMKYNNGTVESNVSVGDNSAMVSAGASSIEVKNEGITNNGKTTFKGAVDATVPTTETTINGNTITTGHLITDRLTITGSGAAAGAGTGTIALGGDGSITSNIKDAATGKEATFKTNAEGTFTHAKDGTNETTNTVNAQGNTNVVTDGTNTSTATQTATSIGGVVTNGTVKMRQELTADGMKVTDELGDPANYTQITDKDVSITDPKNAGERINLSDLGQLNDLDGELTARSEYTSNPTAVGAINAEAGIRREEVARLDNRIDDVNNRVDKVGAMAAAIASLKSIGYDPQAPSEFSIGLGQYKGETGVAMGFFHYPNKNFMINVSLSTAGGETMGGIGATWRFGHKSPQKLLDEQREAQAKKELAAAEKYQAAAKLAKEAQERAEYAAKLARQAQVSADNAKAAADATQAKHF